MRGALALALALSAYLASCSGSSDDPKNNNPDSGAGGSGNDASADDASAPAQSGECSLDVDCTSKLPDTSPAGCAEAKCNRLQRKCEFLAKDGDGDGHRAKTCTAGIVAIQT